MPGFVILPVATLSKRIVTSLAAGLGRSDAIAIVLPSGETTGSRMKPIHLCVPGGAYRPSSTVVGVPPVTATCIKLGTSMRTVEPAHEPCVDRVRTKYTDAPSGENDVIESLPLVVSCVAAPLL